VIEVFDTKATPLDVFPGEKPLYLPRAVAESRLSYGYSPCMLSIIFLSATDIFLELGEFSFKSAADN